MYSIELNFMDKSELQKRLESLAWRVGMMSLAALIDFGAANVGLFNLPPEVTTILGLVLGEISKTIHNKLA
jgi:hypothetical protein